jgi:predicted ATP-dependent serine protease
MQHIDTGIGPLNQLLGGFYFGQLILLTGERGLGKSTLGSQFITQAVSQGVPSFCYSGELPEWFFQDWFDRQCAGPDRINVKISDLGFKNYLVNPETSDQIHEWYDDKIYIYDNTAQASEDGEEEAIIKTIDSAIRQYRCRMLMIDNVMTAISDDLSSDLYRQQSVFVRELVKMAKQYDVIIILVVHPRKKQLQKFDNDDVSGSSNITNLADVVLNYVKAKDNEESEADSWVQITKNRFGGITDYSGIPLYYEPASKRISEGRHIFSWVLGWNAEAQNASDGFEQADDDEEVPF